MKTITHSSLYPLFRTKANRLTVYAFACGYIEETKHNGIELQLYKEGCYHVRMHDFNDHKHISWDSYPTLTQARKRYSVLKRSMV